MLTCDYGEGYPRKITTIQKVPIPMRAYSFIGIVVGLAIAPSLVQAGFISYEIRGTPIINTGVSTTEFVIDHSGDKAGLGSNDINGAKLGSIESLTITRYDDRSRFTAGGGPNVAPYFNLWITDGTNYAVVANEPSNPDFQGLFTANGDGSFTYDLSFADLSGKTVKIYENSYMDWLPNKGVGLTFADLADFTIAAPSASLLAGGWTGLGTGAPRELGTNVAYGVNWIFGDTLSNYVSGDPQRGGYVVGAAAARTVSVPDSASTLTLLLVAFLGMFLGQRRRC